MTAPLRWVLALAAIGALGFAAGRYLGRDGSSSSYPLSFPDFATSDPAPAGATSNSASTSTARTGPRRDPATVREVMALPSDFAQTASLYVLAANSDEEGIKRLLDEAEAIERGSERRSATNVLYERYAELNPEAAVEHYKNRKSEFYPNWLYSVFYGWARKDLDGAIAGAAKLDSENRQAAATAIVRSRDDLSRGEREAMVSQLEVEVPVRDPFTGDLSTPQAAERAWLSALAIPDRKARQGELFKIVQAWARQDPQGAIQGIELLKTRSERDEMTQYAVHAWAQKEPRAAIDWVLQLPPSSQHSNLLSSALGALAQKDPSTAMILVERLPRREQQQVLSDVLLHWASRDARAAAEWTQKPENRRSDNHAFNMVVNIFAQKDPEEALRWAATLSDDERSGVMRQIIEYAAQIDAERASGMISQIDEGPDRSGAISAVAQQLAVTDPRAALAWVARQPGNDVTPDAYAGIFVQWAHYDTDGAVSQLNFMLEPDDRNAAIRGIINGADLEPALLDQLYQRVEGAGAKRTTAMLVYNTLEEKDPERAERYRVLAGLPLEQGEGNED